jgi:hypothetical protein
VCVYLYYYYVSTLRVHFARCTFCRSAHARGRTLRAATAAIPAAPPRIPSSAQPFQPAAECSPAPDSSVPSAGCVPPAAPRPRIPPGRQARFPRPQGFPSHHGSACPTARRSLDLGHAFVAAIIATCPSTSSPTTPHTPHVARPHHTRRRQISPLHMRRVRGPWKGEFDGERGRGDCWPRASASSRIG